MKYLVYVLGILCLGLLVHDLWSNRKANAENSALNEQLMQANLAIGKAETKFGDTKQFIKSLDKEVQQDIKKADGQVSKFGSGIATLSTTTKIESVGTIELVPEKTFYESPDLGIKTGLIYQATSPSSFSEIKRIPFRFDDNRLHIDAWAYGVEGQTDIQYGGSYELKLKIEAVMSEVRLPNGEVNNYLSLYEIDEKDERINKFTIEKLAFVVEDQRKAHFFWWAPHLDVGADLGFSLAKSFVYGGTVGVSVFGYGLTKDDLSWRFLRVGFNVASSLGLDVVPLQYNVAKHIPLLSNMWLGPIVILNFPGPTPAFGLVLSAVL